MEMRSSWLWRKHRWIASRRCGLRRGGNAIWRGESKLNIPGKGLHVKRASAFWDVLCCLFSGLTGTKER